MEPFCKACAGQLKTNTIPVTITVSGTYRAITQKHVQVKCPDCGLEIRNIAPCDHAAQIVVEGKVVPIPCPTPAAFCNNLTMGMETPWLCKPHAEQLAVILDMDED